MKKSFSDSVASLLKSLVGGSGNGDEDDIKKNEGGANGNDPAGNNDDDDIEKNKADPEEDGGNGNDDDDGGDDMSGEDVLKALDADLSDMRKSIEANQEQIQDLGGAIEGLAQMIYVIGNQQLPPKSVLNKSFGGTAEAVVGAVDVGVRVVAVGKDKLIVLGKGPVFFCRNVAVCVIAVVAVSGVHKPVGVDRVVFVGELIVQVGVRVGVTASAGQVRGAGFFCHIPIPF